MTKGRLGPRRRGLVLLAAAAALVSTARVYAQAKAPALTAAEARAVRGVIDAQLAAFAAGDAERTFSYASNGIRSQFGNAARFMAMVQGSYPMVVRPAAVSYLQPQMSDGRVLQMLQLRDGEGRSWVASYRLAWQAKAGWRIEACVVVADSGGTST